VFLECIQVIAIPTNGSKTLGGLVSRRPYLVHRQFKKDGAGFLNATITVLSPPVQYNTVLLPFNEWYLPFN